MSQLNLDTANPLNPTTGSPETAAPNASPRREAADARSGLIGSLPRITLYAGLTVAVGLTILVLALLATGIFGL